MTAYNLQGNFGGKFPSNGTGFFGTEDRNGIELYHLQNTGRFGKNGKRYLLFSGKFELFHLNSPRNFRVFSIQMVSAQCDWLWIT